MVRYRYQNEHPLARLRTEMDTLLDGFLGDSAKIDPFGILRGRAFPALNIWEDERNLCAEAELPGVDIKDVDLRVVGNELTIKGQRKAGAGEGVSYHRRERGAGEFSRTVVLPVDVNAEKVEAKMADGVLAVTLPKAEAAKARRIDVKGA
jgi:HSP20 family protein